MEGRKVLGLAVKSQHALRQSCKATTPWITFSARSTPSSHYQLRTSAFQSRRAFAVSSRCQADNRSSAQGQRESVDGLADMLDKTLDMDKSTPTSSQGRPSHFASRNAQEENKPESRKESNAPSSQRKGNDSSISDLLAAFSNYRQGQAPRGSTLGNKMDTSKLAYPGNYLDPMGNTRGGAPEQLPLPLPVRLGPNLGRTVKVNPTRNIDVGRAFRQLDIMCNRNRVRADFNRQRFHERPGLMRKRLKRERWRRHFKEGFKGMVALVRKMKKQGW